MVAGGLVRPGGRNADIGRRVVSALAHELRERPFDEVTMTGLAARSGVSRATVHRRWADPAAVLTEATDQVLRRRLSRGSGTTSLVAPDPDPRSTDLVVRHLRRLVLWLVDPDVRGLLAAAAGRAAHDELLSRALARAWQHERDDLGRVLRQTIPTAARSDLDGAATGLLVAALGRAVSDDRSPFGPWLGRQVRSTIGGLVAVTRA